MSSPDSISGGYDTARLSAAEQDRAAREERRAAALRYFKRKGMEKDVMLEALGLIEPDVPDRARRRVNGHRLAAWQETS